MGDTSSSEPVSAITPASTRPKRKGRAPRELKDRPLTPQQLLFIEEYLVDFNGKCAAIRAGYSKKTAASIASFLLSKVNVQAEFQKRFQQKRESVGLTKENVLREIARLSFADIRKLYKESGELTPVHELDDDTAACVVGIEVFEEFEGEGKARTKIGETKKYKLASKTEALQMAGRHLKLFTDKHEVESTGGILCVPVAPQSPEEWAKTHQGSGS